MTSLLLISVLQCYCSTVTLSEGGYVYSSLKCAACRGRNGVWVIIIMSPLLNIHQQSCKELLHFGYNLTRNLWRSTITQLLVSKQADKPNIEETQQRAFLHFSYVQWLVQGRMRARAVAICNLTARCQSTLSTILNAETNSSTSQSSPWPIQGQALKLNQGSNCKHWHGNICTVLTINKKNFSVRHGGTL